MVGAVQRTGAQVFAHGAVDYVCKPFDAYEVKARVRTHLQIKKMRDQLLEVASSAKGANSSHLKIAITVAEQLAKPVDRMIALIPQLTAEPDQAKVRASLTTALDDLRRSKALCDRMLAAARGTGSAPPPSLAPRRLSAVIARLLPPRVTSTFVVT